VALRLGISAGETLTLAAKIPGGPLVVTRGDMEIALGREICKGIEVEIQ
jgi:Fe2+ transport system protein FeoA